MLGKTVPLAIADGLAAVTYVRQHASEWGVSPDRVGIMGFSSGGAVTAGVAFHYLPEGRPAFVAPIYSPALGFKDGTVPADAPPMFVAAATDDELGLAPVSVFLYEKWIAARRSEPSICSESLFHDNNLPTLPPKVGFTTLGQSAGFVDPTAGSRELAKRAGQEKRSKKPNPVEDPTGHRSGLQACPACRISASNRAGQSDPLCPPVHSQQLRTDHFDSGSGLRHHQPTGADAAYACSGHRGHCSPDLRDSRAAVEGYRRRKSMHLRSSSLRLREIRQTQVESLKTSRSATSCSRGSSPQLAPGNAVQQARGTCVPLFQTEGEEATTSQHAFVRSPSACSRQSWCCSAAPSIWVPHVPTDAGVGPSGEQLRSEAGARTTPPFQHQDDPGHLCPSHYVGQAGGAGDVPDRTVEGLMGGEETGNELRCVAQTLVLWAYCGLAQIEGFRTSALKYGGQGRS